MAQLKMPPAREYGWALRTFDTAHFDIVQRENGQFCVVLNHALLRGVRAEMLYWWFQNFPNLRVRLLDVPGYEAQSVPAYLLWHPSDHHSATLSGPLGPNGVAQAGAAIHIREAMQYERYGWKYPVDTKVKIFYVGQDGWAMGRMIPFFGPVMMLRIHYKDVFDGGAHLGAHYHYEIVIGLSGDSSVARFVNRQISAKFGPEFFEAWRLHNVIEVGVFENFLPPLYAQRTELSSLEFRRDMDAKALVAYPETGFDKALFDQRVAGYRDVVNPLQYQAFAQRSFL